MTFQMEWYVDGKNYSLQVTRTVANSSIEEFEITAGDKRIAFRCNRPEIKRTGKKQRIKWQLLYKNFALRKNIQHAAQLMLDLQDLLENYIEPKATFRETRTKTIAETGG